jgi:hypothetical protein
VANPAYHPNASDHQAIQAWMQEHFGPGLVGLGYPDDTCYQYRARRRGHASSAAYTLEITQTVFDREKVEEIVHALDRLGVAERLKTDPATRLRYLGAGQITTSPREQRASGATQG